MVVNTQSVANPSVPKVIFPTKKQFLMSESHVTHKDFPIADTIILPEVLIEAPSISNDEDGRYCSNNLPG
jgi:hypothetical protein